MNGDLALDLPTLLTPESVLPAQFEPARHTTGAAGERALMLAVLEDAIHSVEVSNCVMGMFRSAKFPPPSGGCIDAKVPLSFVPREGK